MNYPSKHPVVLISGFKSGTWLMRKIISELTGQPYFEPQFKPGPRKYYDPKNLQFKAGHYYSWHLIPGAEVCHRLLQEGAYTIFLLRNIYDVVVSIYYHFYNNIDNDIGRGTNKHSFLKNFSFSEGISMIITGFEENHIRWNGMKEILEHYDAVFQIAPLVHSLLIDFEQLVINKAESIDRISEFLGVELSRHDRQLLTEASSFSAMKADAEKALIGTSHFREGRVRSNRKRLAPYHCVQLRQMIQLFTPDIYQRAAKNGMRHIITA